MKSAVNSLFSEITPDRLNSEILAETLSIEKLREEVVRRLTEIEKQDLGFWWQDDELLGIFKTVYRSGCIQLPIEPVERLRWIALLCVKMSSLEGFSCGNVVIPPDYLPDDKLEPYEDIYGTEVIEEVVKIRTQLAEKGWEATFPE